MPSIPTGTGVGGRDVDGLLNCVVLYSSRWDGGVRPNIFEGTFATDRKGALDS